MLLVDSNVLLYSVAGRPADLAKTEVADEILRRDDLAFTVQVFQEFYVQATRPKHARPLSHGEAMAVIDRLRNFPVQDLTLGLFDAATAARQRYRISYWDAAILEAARALGCETVLSEDLNAGQDYDGVRVVNPFA